MVIPLSKAALARQVSEASFVRSLGVFVDGAGTYVDFQQLLFSRVPKSGPAAMAEAQQSKKIGAQNQKWRSEGDVLAKRQMQAVRIRILFRLLQLRRCR